MMTSKPSSLLSRYCCLFLCCLLWPLLTGCPKQPLDGGEGGQRPIAQASPLDEAKTAYVRGEYTLAETIAMRLTADGSLSREQAVEANRVLVAAALQNNHPSVALKALEDWRSLVPGVDENKEWQDAWCKALRGLSSHDARTRANELYQDASRSPLIRSIAGVFLAVRQWQDGELGQTMAALENIYTSAGSARNKAVLEGRLALELHRADAAAVVLAAGAVTADNRGKFPYSIVLIEKLRRESLRPQSREAALAALAELSSAITIADPSLFQNPPRESDISIQTSSAGVTPSGPISGQPVVLALPLSGQYAAISAKIQAGAQVACDEMSASGNPVSLTVVDTDQADWVGKLDALPANAAVVGGPLRRDDYKQVKSAGVTSRRAVFAFLPGLEGGDEGHTAWRFFSSAQDQVDTLLAFTSRLGIRGYGVLYPQENFGRRMSALFDERAKALGASTVVTQAYEPGNQNSSMAATGELLSANKTGSVFRAIFLPDSWKNMDVIVPNLFYQNETRQVLLGTSLWEQGLTGAGFVSMQYYNLAVFPGNWNAAHPTPAGQKLQSGLLASGKEGADFWAGLGYDFARFSARIGVGQGWSPSTVNAALQTTSLDWSIAPIRWNNGLASQELHLFTPAERGFKPVNESEFRAAFEDAWR